MTALLCRNLELILSFPGEKSAYEFFMVTFLVEIAAVPGIKVWDGLRNFLISFASTCTVNHIMNTVMTLLQFPNVSSVVVMVLQDTPEVTNGVHQGDVTMETRDLQSISLALGDMKEVLLLFPSRQNIASNKWLFNLQIKFENSSRLDHYLGSFAYKSK